MFSKILIANRGEIVCRVIRTARRLGIRTVAVYSDADRNALHVTMADEASHIGPAPSRESYLLGDKIVHAALETGAEAIHPGYGFLSENAGFSRFCHENGLVFIGPPAGAIEAMGSKSAARKIMAAAGVPLLNGYDGDDQSSATLKQAADDIGYPVLLKAVSGGGGKGMRQVWSPDEFDEALVAAKREALSSFGDDDMLVEKFLARPRHIEIQVFCDRHGNAVHLFERDCSVQRRHQKVVEEAPAPGMSAELREAMGETALRAARAIDYEGAGTVEFLLSDDGGFYFMEMNTRLQVEHPITEMITGQDLVEWQLRVASGEKLPLVQEQLEINGHAIEARIYAEDPENDFLPATGRLSFLQPPPENDHVRVDSGVIQGDEVSVFYDPLIAKLIVRDVNRERACARMATALSEYRVSGVTTNIAFLYNVVTCEPFKEAAVDTGFIESHAGTLFRSSQPDIATDLPLVSLYLLLRQEQLALQRASKGDPISPWNKTNAWRLNEPAEHTGSILLNGESYEVPVQELGNMDNHRFAITACGNTVMASGRLEGNDLYADLDGYRMRVSVVVNDDSFSMFTPRGAVQLAPGRPDFGEDNDHVAGGGLVAPMNGTIIALLAEPGERVEKDQPLIIMEAMKMEHTVRAPADGVVTEHYFKPGDLVDGGTPLLAFEQ